MKIKTSELSGLALDWAVAKCEGVKIRCILPMLSTIHIIGRDNYNPSSNWSLAGPIIERENIGFIPDVVDWAAAYHIMDNDPNHGSTPLEAAMRCYVASKLGDEVEIPEELCR